MENEIKREIVNRSSNGEEGYLHVSGGRVWYRMAGTDKKSVPLLCVHGGPGVPHDYLLPVEALSAERPVIFFDQLGCGNSEKPDNPSLWTLEFFREHLHQVRQGLGLLEDMFLFGQSWGSMLSADYLINKTQQGIRAVIFGGPVMNSKMAAADFDVLLEKLSPAAIEAVRQAKLNQNFTSGAFTAAMDEYNKAYICNLDPWPDFVCASYEKMGMQVYNTMWGPSEFVNSGNLKTFDVTRGLPSIKVPVLYTCGEFDECRPGTVSKFHYLTPNSKLIVMNDASHMHHVEKPEEFLQYVRSFLRQYE